MTSPNKFAPPNVRTFVITIFCYWKRIKQKKKPRTKGFFFFLFFDILLFQTLPYLTTRQQHEHLPTRGRTRAAAGGRSAAATTAGCHNDRRYRPCVPTTHPPATREMCLLVLVPKVPIHLDQIQDHPFARGVCLLSQCRRRLYSRTEVHFWKEVLFFLVRLTLLVLCFTNGYFFSCA